MKGNHWRIRKGRRFNEIQREGQIGYPNKTSNSWNAGNYDQIRSGKRLKSYSAIDTRPLTKVLEVQKGLVACWVYSSCQQRGYSPSGRISHFEEGQVFELGEVSVATMANSRASCSRS
jgi:hypothetical protein